MSNCIKIAIDFKPEVPDGAKSNTKNLLCVATQTHFPNSGGIYSHHITLANQPGGGKAWELCVVVLGTNSFSAPAILQTVVDYLPEGMKIVDVKPPLPVPPRSVQQAVQDAKAIQPTA